MPLLARVPVQPPVAAHDAAFVELHVRVEEPPLGIAVGFAISVAVGAAGMGVTVTVTVATGLVPPGPVQVSEYEALVVRAPVL